LVETGGTFSFQKNGRRKSDTAMTKPCNCINLTRDWRFKWHNKHHKPQTPQAEFVIAFVSVFMGIVELICHPWWTLDGVPWHRINASTSSHHGQWLVCFLCCLWRVHTFD
jgi:hypothetical protein